MMTIIKKQEVLFKLSRLSIRDLKLLERQFSGETDLKEKFYFVSHDYWKGYIPSCIQVGAVLEEFLEKKETGNDAVRGGREGNYILFKNTKSNKEVLEIMKTNIVLLMADTSKGESKGVG